MFPIILGLFALARAGGLVRENGQGWGQKGAHRAGHSHPKGHPDVAVVAQNEGFGSVVAGAFDDFGAPSGRVGDQAQREENSSEGLKWTTNGEDRAANAGSAARGQKREKVGDDHQGQTQAEK